MLLKIARCLPLISQNLVVSCQNVRLRRVDLWSSSLNAGSVVLNRMRLLRRVLSLPDCGIALYVADGDTTYTLKTRRIARLSVNSAEACRFRLLNFSVQRWVESLS